ncbi:hypothetical protein PVK06_047668 [Gossypium arboreum]|uniref:Uncharacterized protein n=1 Tax=Gossypium arboreum TaxID=29729 RepID=A0ABR0MDY1_GOSAR|nr:hypothetical protein PVK06_047668 [Gossypium arboreum]
MKAKNISTVKMAMGSSSSMKGGGGNGGSIKGRMSKDAVRHISRSRDSKLKYFACNDFLPPPCNPSYSPFFLSTTDLPTLIFEYESAHLQQFLFI